MTPTRTAVVLFNLGGPASLNAVRPFLFNLFNDRAIIRLPTLPRFLLAHLISLRRTPFAKKIYEKIGGGSPILENTQAQAAALEQRLMQEGNIRVFVSMRHSPPFSQQVAHEVKLYNPDKIILLPLYPQYSTTTTLSSLKDWKRSAKKAGIETETAAICCFPTERHFIATQLLLLKDAYWKASEHGTPRILFSAHGLPEKIVRAGDPYQWQVEQTVKQIMDIFAAPDTDHVICYQSRVGPLKWIGPSTDDELRRAGADKKSVILVPIAFVSEHSETLVELDIEYKHIAEAAGVPHYERVPTVSVHEEFIESLAQLCIDARDKKGLCPPGGGRVCPAEFKGCPCPV